MKETPILMTGKMVLATLEGRKTQTRRVISQQPGDYCTVYKRPDGRFSWVIKTTEVAVSAPFASRYGRVGDRLWVKETWRVFGGREYEYQQSKTSVQYRADESNFEQKEWRPSIFMPRWASRITLEIVVVKVKRLQDISRQDCEDEGVQVPVDRDGACLLDISSKFSPSKYCDKHFEKWTLDDWMRTHFASLWDSINGKRHPWSSNPWVWVIKFKKL